MSRVDVDVQNGGGIEDLSIGHLDMSRGDVDADVDVDVTVDNVNDVHT